MLSAHMTPQEIDDVLAGTFPASDPPSWTPGLARPAPAIASRPAISPAAHLAHALVSLVETAGLALLFPLAILAVGVPVALVVRALLELARWVMAID